MKKALVLGLGISGVAAVELLLSLGFEVIGVDSNEERVANLKQERATLQLDTVEIDFNGLSLLILSPGISLEHPLCRKAAALGVEIIGEAELAFRHIKQRCVGITGTNGKTTVTLLVEHVLNFCGIKAKALGNVGEPLSAYVLSGGGEEIVVAELSSYQLETMGTQVFDGAVILNITPDHLDRYGTMEAYAKAKWKIASCLKAGAPLFVHKTIFNEAPPGCEMFGALPGVWSDKKAIYKGEHLETLLPLQYRQWGIHESENATAAWVLCRLFGVEPPLFCQALQTFNKPAHRLEFVTSFNEVSYYDDSKGTNIDAVVQAVGAMRGPVILIAGGVHKGSSYLPWCKPFEGKVKKIIAIGESAPTIESELSSFFAIERAETLSRAVALASACAERGDNVLLSPGCSSFDMFRDYAHRGMEFQRQVHIEIEERRK